MASGSSGRGVGRGRGNGRGGRLVGGGRGNGRGGRLVGGGRGNESGKCTPAISQPMTPLDGSGIGDVSGANISVADTSPPITPTGGGRTGSSSSAPPLADDSPRSPATPASGSSPTDHILTLSSINDITSSSTKPRLDIRFGCFTPSHKASAQITKCIKQRFHKDGYNWSAVPQDIKEYYWNEFQKHFSFDRSLESVIRTIWERQASKRYSNTLSDWRKSGKRPQCVSEEIWDNWQHCWNSPDFKNKCNIASKNRLTEVEGPDTGLSRHTGGSRSAVDHSIEFAKERSGQPVTDYDIFERIHKTKKDDSFIDQRSKIIADKVMERYNTANENQSDGTSSESVDMSKIYYEVVGPSKKKRCYGLGGKPFATAVSSSSTSATVDSHQLRTEIYEEVRDAVRDELREEMRQREEEIERQMKQRQELMEQELKKKQEEMEAMIQRLLSGVAGTMLSSNPPPTNDDEEAEDQD